MSRIYGVLANGRVLPAFEEDGEVRMVDAPEGLLSLFSAAAAGDGPVQALIRQRLAGPPLALERLATDGLLRHPVSHPDPAHCLVTGTGLTHLSSALARDRMNAAKGRSDSLAMYRAGLEGGKPADNQTGIQPEWFFKGLGHCLAETGTSVAIPPYAASFGEEPEIAGVYLVDDAGQPHRLGFLLVNDFSDHRLEASNYLYVAPSKLHACGVGPALLLGALPTTVEGETCILRAGRPYWRATFQTGEAHMSHSIANLEHHHFKHRTLLHPGDLHIHMFGCPRFSYDEGIVLEEGDVVEVRVDAFGPIPMRHRIVRMPEAERRIAVKKACP